MEFVDVCSLEELREEKRKLVEVRNQKIVLFYLRGEVYAINAVCAHKGGPLEDGEINDEEVICPWHGFMYNIKTGACLNHPGFSVRSFKVKIEGETVKVGVD